VPAKPATASDAARDLRVYLLVEDLQAQFAAAMATPTRVRGYPPLAGQQRWSSRWRRDC
jgi:hypothetical protein